MRKITKHRPRHINQNQNPYFVTGKTYFGLPYFDTPEKKESALLSAINLACENYHLALGAWTILDNHYHLLFRPPGCAWDVGIARSSTFKCDGRIADKPASSGGIAGKPATSNDEVARLRAIENFRIGKVVGTIHGKSSSLLKKIADKSASSKKRSSALARDGRIADKSATSYADWWNAKYWERIKDQNIALYGKRSQLAEEKRTRKFCQLLNEGTPQELVEFVNNISRIWYQYTDHIIRDERDYWVHFNYIHQNSVKHGYSKNMWNYRFSSIHGYERDWIVDCFRRYPVLDFEPEMEDFD